MTTARVQVDSPPVVLDRGVGEGQIVVPGLGGETVALGNNRGNPDILDDGVGDGDARS